MERRQVRSKHLDRRVHRGRGWPRRGSHVVVYGQAFFQRTGASGFWPGQRSTAGQLAGPRYAEHD
jgi:hypothetical protein